MFLNNQSFSLTRMMTAGLLSGLLSISSALEAGVIDDNLLVNSKSFQGLIEPVKTTFSDVEKEVLALSTQLQKANIEFAKNHTMLDDKTRQENEKSITVLAEQLRAKVALMQEKHAVLTKQERHYLEVAAQQLAHAKKLDIVLAKNKGVLYVAPNLDVTKEAESYLIQPLTEESKAALGARIENK